MIAEWIIVPIAVVCVAIGYAIVYVKEGRIREQISRDVDRDIQDKANRRRTEAHWQNREYDESAEWI